MRGIGIVPGYRPHYLDHLVPLCQWMHIPILVTHPWMQELIQRYYPPMEIILYEPSDYILDPILQGYDTFFYVEYSRKGHGMFQFQEYVTSHRARSVISLHGNPDKYRDLYWLEKLVDEDLVLVYGPQLHADLLEKNIGKEPLFSGNYRAAFYQENLSFFTATLPFVKTKPLVLYAPTWAAKEVSSPLKKHYTPFFSVCHALFESLGEEYQLIVKLHPLLIQSMLDEVESIKERYPHLYFLDDFPLIYPILEQVDFYIGDYSSIGYDFLFFDRPLFFIEPSVQTPLHRYGRVISREELYSFPEEGEHASRQEAYHYAFGEKKGRRVLQQEIREAMCDDRRSHRSVANR